MKLATPFRRPTLQGRFVRQRWITALLQDQHGGSLIETSMVMLVATLLIFGIFEFSMLGYTYATVYEAAHQGLRYAEVNGTDTGNYLTGCSTSAPSAVITKIQNVAALSLHDVSKLSVNVCYPDSTGSQPLSRVQITVSYTYVPFFNLPGLAQTMNVYSEGRIAY